MKLNGPRKLSHEGSPVTQLKLLWRKSIAEDDKDYWREQFGSERTRKELRQELAERYMIELKQDVQLARFCNWLEEEDLRQGVYEDVLSDRAELAEQGVEPLRLQEELVRRMMERALARGDFKLGAKAVKLASELQKVSFQHKRTQFQGERVEVAKQRVAIARERLDLQVRKVKAVEAEQEREKEEAARPGGLTKDVLEKIERKMNLFPPYFMKDGKKVFINTAALPEDEFEEEEPVVEEEPVAEEEPEETAEEYLLRKEDEARQQWRKEHLFE